MTDHDAMVRAICESPDDDTPRLIYADFLEESGEAARAEFVRSQVELARTPDWEPLAVLCRTRRIEWSEAGEPFRASLPPLGPDVTWHDQAFHRGLGWRVNISNLRNWAAIAPRLYERAPVGELHLNPPATRDDWREFAFGEWAKWFRVIHLEGGSPVEPVRALCESPDACGITDIHFHPSTSPGLPELVEDLLATPLGRGLKGLHFSVGNLVIAPLLAAIRNSRVRLKRLTMRSMQLNGERMLELLNLPLTSELEELTLSSDRLGEHGWWEPALPDDPQWMSSLPSSLHTLHIVESSLGRTEFEAFAEEPFLPALRSLDLSRNYNLSRSEDFLNYRSTNMVRRLAMRSCGFETGTWRRLAQSRTWMNLVHLDVRGIPVGEAATRRLIQAPMPPDLVAIQMDAPADLKHRAALEDRYGERLVVEEAPQL